MLPSTGEEEGSRQTSPSTAGNHKGCFNAGGREDEGNFQDLATAQHSTLGCSIQFLYSCKEAGRGGRSEGGGGEGGRERRRKG